MDHYIDDQLQILIEVGLHEELVEEDEALSVAVVFEATKAFLDERG